jgi:hypothetical protein
VDINEQLCSYDTTADFYHLGYGRVIGAVGTLYSTGASLGDAEEKMQWVFDHDKEAQEIAHRGGLWMKAMVHHPEAVYKEILRRYQSHFRASGKLVRV